MSNITPYSYKLKVFDAVAEIETIWTFADVAELEDVMRIFHAVGYLIDVTAFGRDADGDDYYTDWVWLRSPTMPTTWEWIPKQIAVVPSDEDFCDFVTNFEF